MITITTEQVKELRGKTGVSVMQCRKALEEAKGDMELAMNILRKRGAEIAAKKSTRALGAGVVAAYVHVNGALGALVELSCETDFVSGNAEFKALAYDIAMQVAASRPEWVRREEIPEETLRSLSALFEPDAAGKTEAIQAKIIEGKVNAHLAERVLLLQPFIKNPEQTIGALIEAAVQRFGERIEVARTARFEVGK